MQQLVPVSIFMETLPQRPLLKFAEITEIERLG